MTSCGHPADEDEILSHRPPGQVPDASARPPDLLAQDIYPKSAPEKADPETWVTDYSGHIVNILNTHKLL